MECYVCTELISYKNCKQLCACQNMVLHTSCQRRLLETVSRDGKCRICLQSYNNIHARDGIAQAQACLLYTLMLAFQLTTSIMLLYTLNQTVYAIQNIELYSPDAKTMLKEYLSLFLQCTQLSMYVFIIATMHALSVIFTWNHLHHLIQLKKPHWKIDGDAGVGIQTLVSASLGVA